MDMYLSPTPREVEMLVRRHRLATKINDLMLEPRAMDFRKTRIVQVAQVDATDFRAERAGERNYLDPLIGSLVSSGVW